MTSSVNDNPTDGGSPEQVVSNEELQAKADEVQDLREEVARVESERVAREASLSNQISMTQLEEEEARLRARLAQAQSAVEGGATDTASPLTTVREQMQAAVQQQEAAEAAARGEEYESPSSAGDTESPEPEQGTSQDTNTEGSSL